MPNITCKIVGGMSNQLFIIAAMINISKKYPNYTPIIYTSMVDEHIHHPDKLYYIKNIFDITFEINDKDTPLGYHEISEDTINTYPYDTTDRNIILVGYFQGMSYLPSFSVMEELFPFPIVKKVWSDNIEPVGIHMRRGDYLGASYFHLVQRNEIYWKNAILYMKKLLHNKDNVKFIVFSDDINWCKTYCKSIPIPYQDFIFIEEGTDIYQFSLMTQCDYFILSNSSFSWLGSFYNPNSKYLICPYPWINIENRLNSEIYKDRPFIILT
jgi:hypothetical protein